MKNLQLPSFIQVIVYLMNHNNSVLTKSEIEKSSNILVVVVKLRNLEAVKIF